mgnify:CR=1 FL=1|jgi:hypothetical protein
MKKTGMILLAFAAAGWLSAVELVKNGKPAAVIYVDMPLSYEALPLFERDVERLGNEEQQKRILGAAVRDLNYHLKKMSGAELPVVTAKPGDSQSAIIISPRSGEQDEFALKASGNRLSIEGVGGAAAAYGIYEILQRIGCDWVMPGEIGEVIPQKDTVTVADFEFSSKPDFAVRCPWYSGGRKHHTDRERAEYNQWKLRHKLQLNRDWHPLVMKGGHVSDALLRLYKKDFDADPEMLALVRQPDGSLKRQGPQLETTNAKTLAVYEDYIRQMFKKNKWPNDYKVCIGIGPADGAGFSESVESTLASSGRIDPMTGTPDFTDLQILLGNQLLERLEKDFPNLYLGFYLYNTHADYPVRYKPHPRTLIVLADISYSRHHSTLEPISKTRVYYRDILEKWAQTDVPKFFRGYNWNLAENFLPYSKLKMWGEDLPYYHKMGTLGVYNESSKAWAVLAPGNYLEAVLLWDSSKDWHEVLKKYCLGAFGKGAPYMEEYYLMLTEQQSRAGQEAGSYHSFSLMYDRAFMDRAAALFDAAAENAEMPAEKRRVAIARMPLEMLELFLAFRQAMNHFEFVRALEIFNTLKDMQTREIEAGNGLVCKSSVTYLNRFFKNTVEESARYSTAPYRIAYRIPDYLKTIFDPYDQGHVMGYFNPELNDRAYLRTATISSTWDAQGLMGYRFGSVWYRVEIPTPAEKDVGLLIGGADSIVRVWSNGRYIGMGQGFAKPFLFDLTGTLRADGRNLLAIQVQRFGNSEVGTGGLIYPSFVFTGPRLKERAPNPAPTERLLPGGAVEEIVK